MKKLLLLFSFCFVLMNLAIAQPTGKKTFHADNRVRLKSGIVEGGADAAGIKYFKGIPFAAPPVDELRWKAPAPVAAWTGIKKCTEFGPSPMQGSPSPFGPWTEEFLIPKEPISEDCLYLNVWTASTSSRSKKPVVVWIYGGGFGSGGTGVPIYDGAATAAKGIVFVSMNYRVGVFGFLAHPELTKESGHNASGNYGLMDQIAALKWVKENIAAFGGDPGNVTIAGQSAGSMSVNCLVASPLAKGLFNKAIAESGAMMVPGSARGNVPLQKAEESGASWVGKFGNASIAAARKLSADEVLKKGGFQAGPIIDGYVLPQAVSKIFADGNANDVVLLTGWNEADGIMFGQPKNAADFRKQLVQEFPKDSAAALAFYPASTDEAAANSQANISRDRIFGVQNYAWAKWQSEAGKKVYVYRFARKVPATGEYVKYGAFHTGEVPYVYDNLKFSKRPSVVADYALAKSMAAYWANFILTGNPNGKGLDEWPNFTAANKSVMFFDAKSTVQQLPDAGALDLIYRTMQIK